MAKKIVLLFFMVSLSFSIYAQDQGRLSGNFQMDVQSYRADSLIGADAIPEKMALNSYANIRYELGDFSAGLRFEGYMNALQGFDPGYDGVGVPYFFARYRFDDLDFTVGDFYEQFGSGILLRTWEDKFLGVDNAMRGIRVKYHPFEGISLTGVVGKQRLFWEYGPGLIRGLDGELRINDLIPALKDKQTLLSLGGSFVSKYQADDDPVYILPENVGAWAYRFNITRGALHLDSEYAGKINDPSADNNFIYKPGNSLIVNASYAASGLGMNFSVKRVDNMSFRSDRTENLNKLMMGYLPPISKNYTYSLMNLYPYSSQPTGEMGAQGEISYNIRRGTKLGGKYGTQITLNVSMVNSLDKTALNDTTAIGANGTLGYTSEFFKLGKELYYRDYNVEISRKLSKKWKFTGIYQHIAYNQMIMEGKGAVINADLAVLEVTWRLAPKQALRVETQGLWTKEDKGNWAMLLAEYSISPHWFFSVSDQYNYGNPDEEKRVHYLFASFGYVKNANRIQLSYGKQREGILCVGGVCRNVPAMNGFTLSITSSF
ncbi:MAG: hypothetical protein KAH17_00780 [Bacteroidales bacterium]|nr:hypothetical protein [Bacteroidales bacterium]